MKSVELLCPGNSRLAEGPLWDHRCGRLLWFDVLDGIVYAWRPISGASELLRFDGLIGAMALCGEEDLLLATSGGLAHWSAYTAEITVLCNPIFGKGLRFNDGRVDAAGRFWVGTMPRDPARYRESLGALFRYDPDGSIRCMAEGLTISNGLDWSPDGRTLYVTDTMRQLIRAYDFDAQTGTIRNPRIFATPDSDHGRPDGLAVDTAGHVWSAGFRGGAILRYDPDGRLTEKVKMPVSCPTSIAFGGDSLSRLFITTATSLEKDEPGAGSVFALSLPICGKPEVVFEGAAR